ncbi:LOW QUALITY PROTEIN: uncharacterized protein LOC128259708 [Drosophila gunungcola]|uniref:LOW QUALITY PROTEIN: uncharacterized protein LOC128259708 n=1 Tax=Drosophila gunungcola TaxID=103775 RepID=UPI0022E43E7B|nr:LOW QUALITY PROTEIN: uncharacterized protein LOC128259708 [Drosophila gunungcola]
MLALITSAESSGKSRNREDRFDLENESVESKQSDEIIASCKSSESAEENSCRQSETKHHKRKTFRFAI